MENEEKNEEQQSKPEELENKNEGNKFRGFLKNVGKSLWDQGNKLKKWTKEELEKIQDGIEFKKELRKETYEFKIEGTNESFRGFKSPEDTTIFFRVQDQRVLKMVKSNSILVRTSDNMKLQVISVETRRVENGSLFVNGEEVPISLFSIQTKIYEKERVPAIVNNVTQNMSISGSSIHGNIHQVADISSKLNDFEDQLKAFKPKMLYKTQHAEAIKIYGDIKDSIIRGEKESSKIETFMVLLAKLGGGLLAGFSSIIK